MICIARTRDNLCLTTILNTPTVVHIVRQYSTNEVAKRIGVNKSTLLRWLYSRKLHEPKIVKTPGTVIRVWSEADLRRAWRFKEQNYCKGRGRKKTGGLK
jgi:hypothetical protein